jgi:hypothetical protein
MFLWNVIVSNQVIYKETKRSRTKFTSMELYTGRFITLLACFTALRFTATGESPAANFADESACLMPDNVWN